MMHHKACAALNHIAGFAFAGVLALATAGCGSGALLTATPAVENFTTPVLQGATHGGQQPVSGSNIQLWAVGMPSTGGAYGAGQTSLLTTPVTTDGFGNFTITGDYTCPANSYVYITATGGNPGAGNNSAAVLMAALGPCSALSATTFININEASTVAGVWALQQFAAANFGTAGSFGIGAPSSNALGLQNAFAAVPNMVPVGTGVISSSTPIAATLGANSITVNVQNEAAKLGTLANILAYCINSADTGSGISSNCSTLFNAVKPAGRTSAAADTLQAALDLALYPTNVGSASAPPFNLTSPQPPFAGLSTPPTDWQLALTYSSPSLLTTGANKNYFLYAGVDLAIDGSGNVVVLNATSSSGAAPYYSSIGVMSPGGSAVASYIGTAFAGARGIAVDTSNNVWVANSGASTAGSAALIEYTNAGAAVNFAYPGGALYGVGVDGSNNVFATYQGSASGSATPALLELVNGAGTLTSLGITVGSTPSMIAIDSASNVWVSNTGSATVTEAVATCSSTPCTYSSSTNFTKLTTAFGVAIDKNQIPWVSLESNFAVQLTPASPTSGGTSTASGAGGLSGPRYAAMDGASNLWVANTNSTGTAGQAGGVSEFSNSLGVLSPTTTGGFSHIFATARGIAIDQSGNVWVSNFTGTNVATAPVLTEIVGNAAPAVQPLALALKNGKVGVRP